MTKLRTFVRTFIKSCFDPSYYRDIWHAKPSFSWQYFLFLQAILSVIVTVWVMIPIAAFNLSATISDVVKHYPQELVIKLDQSGVHINQPLPYQIAMPKEKQYYDMQEGDTPDYLVTFADDATVNGLSDVYAYDSVAVVTQSTAYFIKDLDTREVRAYPLTNGEMTQPLEVSAAQIEMWKNKVMELPVIKHRWYVAPIAAVIFTFVWVGMTLVRLITLAIYTAAVWVAVKVFFKGKTFEYGTLFRFGLHSLTLIVLIAMITSYAGYDVLHGGWYFLAYLIWTLVCVNAAAGSSTTRMAAAPKAIAKSRAKKPAAKAKRK